MYDELLCEAPLPTNDVDDNDRTYQTKSLECGLHNYRITDDGCLELIWRFNDPSIERRLVDFTGEVWFYDFVRPWESGKDCGWIEFKATFKRGRLTRPIELIEFRQGVEE